MFYIDVRTPGKNYDEFYRRAVEQYGVDYIKGVFALDEFVFHLVIDRSGAAVHFAKPAFAGLERLPKRRHIAKRVPAAFRRSLFRR